MSLNHQEVISQLGGPFGATAYVGTSRMTKCDTSLNLHVNGRIGYRTFISIAIRPDDTYTVILASIRGTNYEIHDERHEVYCDELQAVVEQMYDSHMNEHNRGYIPLR
jgi:hypothetical protein